MMTEAVAAHIEVRSAFVLHTIQLLIQYIYTFLHTPPNKTHLIFYNVFKVALQCLILKEFEMLRL